MGGTKQGSFPRTPNSHLNYDHKLFEVVETPFGNSAFEPQFKFGHGLSYTNFEYSNLNLVADNNTGEIGISVDVQNTGDVEGDLISRRIGNRLSSGCSPKGSAIIARSLFQRNKLRVDF